MKWFWTVGSAPLVVLSAAGVLAALAPAGIAHADSDVAVTSRISVATDGSQGNKESNNTALSADGRFVAFDSDATNLVPDDTNANTDVFVQDRLTGTTTRVSVASDGSQGTADSHWDNPYSADPSISADGRYVSFTSGAPNFVPDDTNQSSDVFVHDRQTGTTTRASVKSDGSGDDGGFYNGLSANARFVTFISDSSKLVPGDTNGKRDAFVHDRETGRTTRVSVSTSGEQGNGATDYSTPVISDDGRFVAFRSWASNLVPGDTNDATDVFLRDTELGTTIRISVASDGTEANELSYEPSMTPDGRYIAYGSAASNLVSGDTNRAADVFRYDRLTRTTIRISPATAIYTAFLPDGARGAVISSDGQHVAYWSDGVNIVPDDTNNALDVFMYDVATGVTGRVSRTATGAQAETWNGWFPTQNEISISADAQYISYHSGATNLVDADTNGVGDVFVSRRP